MSQEQSDHPKPAKQEQYVDDLAEPGDGWLTFTDAARVTRRQEISIRRWVYSGQLPVRREKAGLNKRSRQVRISDLRKLTPIIDLEGAISGAPGQFNLMSIPEQQATILIEHQQLVTNQTTLTQAVQSFQQQLDNQTKNTRQALDAQFQQVSALLQAMRTEHTSQLKQHEEALQTQQQRFQATVITQMEELTADVQEQASQLAQETATHQDVHLRLQPRMTTLEETVRSLQQETTTQQLRLQQDLATFEQQASQKHQEVQVWLNQFADRMEQALNQVIEQFETSQASLEAQIATLRTQASEQTNTWTKRFERLEAALKEGRAGAKRAPRPN